LSYPGRASAPTTDLAVDNWIENGQPDADVLTRTPILDKAPSRGDREIRIRDLMKELRAVFPYMRTVCFGNQGNQQKGKGKRVITDNDVRFDEGKQGHH
jgi:hypothetical protein